MAICIYYVFMYLYSNVGECVLTHLCYIIRSLGGVRTGRVLTLPEI